MSIKLMSAIFATKFRDLKDATGNVTKGSTAKLVLLALADHANDNGEGAYPGLTKMELKTGLSHQTILSAYKTLKHNGLITYIGKSKLRTCDYTINAQCFPGKGEPLILGNQADVPLKPLEYQDSSHLSEECKPLECQDSSHLSEGCKPLECQDSSHLSEECKPLEYQDSSHLSGVLKPLELNQSLTTLKPLNDDNDEEKIAAKLKILSHLYETTIGAITPLMADLLRNAAIDYPEEWFEPAFEAAVKNNVRRWVYVETILDGWERNGFGWKPESVSDPPFAADIFAFVQPRRGQNGEDQPHYKIPEYSEAELAIHR